MLIFLFYWNFKVCPSWKKNKIEIDRNPNCQLRIKDGKALPAMVCTFLYTRCWDWFGFILIQNIKPGRKPWRALVYKNKILNNFFFFSSIHKFGLSVCLYPINVKTAEPIGPKFVVGHLGTPGKVYEWLKF